LRKNLATARRKWKKTQNNQAYEGFSRARVVYFQEIKSAKTQCWDRFLEEARNKDIFKAYQYVKQRKVEKLPIIEFKTEKGPEKAVTFDQKCEAFMKTLFVQPPQSEAPTWDGYQEKEWEWPRVTSDEIKRAIFTSSTKKAPGPDEIAFLIIQKAYQVIPNRFDDIFKRLVDSGYHPPQ
jgi:hypothetical protein